MGIIRCNGKCSDCFFREAHRTHSVYVVEAERIGLTKIGKAANPKERLYAHKRMHRSSRLIAYWVVGCEPKALGAEKVALKMMDPRSRVHGDWFAVPGKLVARWVGGLFSA